MEDAIFIALVDVQPRQVMGIVAWGHSRAHEDNHTIPNLAWRRAKARLVL